MEATFVTSLEEMRSRAASPITLVDEYLSAFKEEPLDASFDTVGRFVPKWLKSWFESTAISFVASVGVKFGIGSYNLLASFGGEVKFGEGNCDIESKCALLC